MTDQQPPPHGPGGIGPERYADDRRRYRLDARIATGGMGEVWRATDTTLGRQVAVKVLKSEYADDATFRSRFATEAQHAAALDHPGVAAVYDVGEAQTAGTLDGLGTARGDGSGTPRPYLVMELVDGQPLSALLSDGRRSGRHVDREVLRDLLAQSATAIGAAHAAGIIHRDVKPANLLVTRDRRIKITDFGIARAADATAITRTGQVMGTPQYLSPEQARGEPATPASDVYALGVVAFECLAGRRPFEADSPVATALAHLQQPVPELPTDVPADLAAVVRTALSKNPADRFPDGAAFAAALRDPATAVLPAAAAGVTEGAGEGTRVMPVAAAGAVADDGPSTLESQVNDPAPLPVTPAGDGTASDSRSSVLLLVVAGFLLVLLIFFVIFVVRGQTSGTTEPGTGPTSDTASPSASPSQSATQESPSEQAPTEPASVTVVEGDYVGRSFDDAAASLDDLGLGAQRNEVSNDGSLTEGQVVSVNPTGEVDEGSTITLDVAGPAPDPSPSQDQSPSAPTTSPAASTPAPSTPAPGDATSPTSSRGKAPGSEKAAKDLRVTDDGTDKDKGKGGKTA